MSIPRRILVTGGAGYIGSHTCKRLALEGLEPVVFDNLRHGHRHNVKWGPLAVGDLLDEGRLAEVFEQYRPEAVIHFAALAYVGESVERPAGYYRNNVAGTLTLLSAMAKANVGTIVFSSTCATYGVPRRLPIREDFEQRPINPYGASKLMVERILADYGRAYGLRSAILRYFNASGADRDGELKEEHDPETHLIPRCLMAADHRLSAVEIFGDDYDTPDGTCIRDYIHVEDLANGHVKALAALSAEVPRIVLNLGTGKGTSVREILDAVERITGRKVPHIIHPRRPGDPPELLADVAAARRVIGFETRCSDIDNIISTAASTFIR